MDIAVLLRSTALAAIVLSQPTSAATLAEIADDCPAALAAGDKTAFSAVVVEVRKLKNIFETQRIAAINECLSEGTGEPWIYYVPSSKFMSQAEYEVTYRLADEAKRRSAEAEAEAERTAAAESAAREENAVRVGILVYASCSSLFARDEVAAMTNQLCVETFLANGLPPD